ncbi:MAG: hypothetical protein U9R43_04265 [Thermodesulfobacteriota bacterium]|nr:hypothetical protein [Thermodesulfobacteriota bacterium]
MSLGVDSGTLLDILTYRIVNRSEVLSSGRQPHKVQARSLVCFLASRELDMSMVQLSKRLKISQPAVSQSATSGEKIAKENKLKLLKSNQHIKECPAS